MLALFLLISANLNFAQAAPVSDARAQHCHNHLNDYVRNEAEKEGKPVVFLQDRDYPKTEVAKEAMKAAAFGKLPPICQPAPQERDYKTSDILLAAGEYSERQKKQREELVESASKIKPQKRRTADEINAMVPPKKVGIYTKTVIHRPLSKEDLQKMLKTKKSKQTAKTKVIEDRSAKKEVDQPTDDLPTKPKEKLKARPVH